MVTLVRLARRHTEPERTSDMKYPPGRVQRGSTGIKILFFTVRALDTYILAPMFLHTGIPLKTRYDAMAQMRLV